MLVAAPSCGGPSDDEAALPVGIEQGNRAPPLQGRLASGEAFELRTGTPVVITFYRGGYCGLCRLRLGELQQNLAAYRKLGARVVAATPEPPGRAAETARAVGSEFPIVSVDSAALRRWGVLRRSGEPPVPGTFVLDRKGVVLFGHIGATAADRVGDATLLTVLQRHQNGE